MAASNKPTGVHYSLIAFVMLTLIFGVMAFMFHKDLQQKNADVAAATKKAGEESTAAKRALEDRENLKKVIGHLYEGIGTIDDQNANTVIGAMRADIRLAGDPAQATYSAAIRKLYDDLRNTTNDRDKLRAELDSLNSRLLALQSEYQGQVDERKSATEKAEGDLAEKTKTTDEQLDQKEKDILVLTTEIKELQTENDQQREQAERDRKQKEGEISRLTLINIRMQEEIDQLKTVSFERPHGHVVEVDNVNRLVWINLGEADNLPLRTTFSVYSKNNSGVARGAVDVKASIEVTRILEPHLAEARILKDNIYEPIGAMDPIYTPLWSPGRGVQISVVGKLDLDGDGTEDRELFHELVASANARIDNEVDDKGNRTGSGIGVNTKFLVIGDIPEIAESEGEEAALLKEIQTHATAMRKEAREQGVRIINLADFLSYLGYERNTRVFRPGDRRPYNLKSGARSLSVGETLGNRKSAGTTSGSYKKNRTRPKTSSGQTSKLFRGATGN